jgi:GDP-mannose 6-dehydrogenase
MKVNIFGLGYVGCVSAACLACDGHTVHGYDVDPLKVDMINAGKSPIREPGLEEKLKEAVSSGRLTASRNSIVEADVSLICVGTPSNDNGSQNLTFVKKVIQQLGEFLATSRHYHVVNVRSTVLPGTVEGVLIPLLEKHSGKRRGVDFGVCMNPEFLREGTSVADFYDPPFTVIGQLDGKSGDVVARLYRAVKAPALRAGLKSAETVKFVSNAFHALKVTFANEVGTLCKAAGVDSREVMDLVCQDRKLNISPTYLKPGFAFGGSCLPKDLRAIVHKARELDVETPLLSAVLPSNHLQVERAFELIKKTKKKKVGIIGLSFKAGTDDLRESPMVDLIEKLLGKGYEVSVFDEEVSYSRLHGSNKRYIEKVIPHISQLLRESLAETLKESEVIVLGSKTKNPEEVLAGVNGHVRVVDLVSAPRFEQVMPTRYDGICW